LEEGNPTGDPENYDRLGSPTLPCTATEGGCDPGINTSLKGIFGEREKRLKHATVSLGSSFGVERANYNITEVSPQGESSKINEKRKTWEKRKKSKRIQM